jgi:hypothetical protein
LDTPEGYDPRIRDALDAANWEGDVLPRVLSYAKRMASLFSRLGFEVEPSELVSEAISRAYGVGSKHNDECTYRNWNQEACPDLHVFICGIIKSIISQRCEHHEKHHYFNTDYKAEVGADRNDKDASDKLHTYLSSPENPEDALANAQDQDLAKQREIFDQLFCDDEEIMMTWMAIEEVGGRPSLIAEVTGYSVEKVYNIKRRVKDRLRPYVDKPEREPLTGGARR